MDLLREAVTLCQHFPGHFHVDLIVGLLSMLAEHHLGFPWYLGSSRKRSRKVDRHAYGFPILLAFFRPFPFSDFLVKQLGKKAI